MTHFMRSAAFAAMAAVVSLGAASEVSAKDCKSETLVKAGEPFMSRSLGAYPSSLLAWRAAAKEKYGDGWQNWSQAEDAKIDCKQNASNRWVCTRTARACQGGFKLTLPTKPAGTPGITQKLVRGDSGDEVKTLQELLRKHGYDVKVDGKFGAGTERAVRDFQKAHKLDIDGRVGPKTLEKLVA